MKLAQVAPNEFSVERAAEMAGPAPTARTVGDLQRENDRLRREVAELESYRNLAYRDPLTGLWNRRYFNDRLNQEISLCRRGGARRFSLLALDMNDLKRINDVEGHGAGDLAIKRAAQFLRSRLREHDVCCRLGGDEFAVILREVGTTECQQLINRLRSELSEHNAKRSTPLSLSMGTASFPEDSATARGLYLRADEVMYEDKRRQKRIGNQIDVR